MLVFQTHLTFGQEFTQAVEQKQVAQQEAERARYLVEKVSHTFTVCVGRFLQLPEHLTFGRVHRLNKGGECGVVVVESSTWEREFQHDMTEKLLANILL